MKLIKKEVCKSYSDIDGGPTSVVVYRLFGILPVWFEEILD